MLLSGAEPMRMRRAHRRQPDHAPFHFVLVDGEEQDAAVAITGNQFDVQTEKIAQQDRYIVAGGTFSRPSEHHRRAARTARILDRFDRRVLAQHQQIGVIAIARRGTEPGEFARIKLHIGIAAKKRDQHHVARKQTERGAVLGRDRIDVVRCAQAAGSRHVLHHHARIARDVSADVAREQAGIDVIAAARAKASDQAHLVTAIEVGDFIGAGAG